MCFDALEVTILSAKKGHRGLFYVFPVAIDLVVIVWLCVGASSTGKHFNSIDNDDDLDYTDFMSSQPAKGYALFGLAIVLRYVLLSKP